MGMSEDFFWESTPRKIIALIDQKKEIQKIQQKNLSIYIASYVWGKDPDEIEKEKNRKIPGIDIPADINAVSSLF